MGETSSARKKKGSDKSFYRTTQYQSHYVPMPDGTKIAVDVLLPGVTGQNLTGKHDVALIQCRYMRGLALRWPLSLLSGRRPIDLIQQDLKLALLRDNYAVVSIDVRGTGASYGRWRALWNPEENDDSLQVLRWIEQQSWSTGQVVLCGMSYEATAALFTLAHRHPSVKAAVLRFPFWDPYNDIACPGGVPHMRFAKNWSNVTEALDKNSLGGLHWVLNMFFRGCQPVLEGQLPTVSDFGLASWNAWLRYRKAKQIGMKQLKAAVNEHKSFNALKSMQTIRFVDQVDEQSQLKITDIRDAKVPMLLIAGWLDATAASAISLFMQTAKLPGSQLLIGPWTHGGLTECSVGHQQSSGKSTFDQIEHVIRFLNQILPRQKLQRGNSASSVRMQRQDSDRQKGSAIHNTSAAQEASNIATDTLVPARVPTSPFTSEQGGDAESSADLPSNLAVHYYGMGSNPGWRSMSAWPQASDCVKRDAYLSGGAGPEQGSLIWKKPSGASTWEHTIDAWKHPQGQSRYDCMTDLRSPICYKNLDRCGHVLFTSEPLEEPLEVTGWAEVSLWVSSCDQDVDLFCYLESWDPSSEEAVYITEGTFRASHRKLATGNDARCFALPAGVPHHTFSAVDACALLPKESVHCRFPMLPTSYTYSKGHCIRLAISGSDAQNFYSDFACDGTRRFWLESTTDRPSCLTFSKPVN